MLTREKVLIINAVHRHSTYNRSLVNAANTANALSHGPEYIVVEANFDTANGGQTTQERVAALTAQAATTHQPIRIYQCVDYNEGVTGSPDSSIPNLIAYNNAAHIAAPITFIFDGSNATARQRDERQYGQGDYRNIMKFIPGLKTGLQPAPSPSPDSSSAAMHPRSTSAPPAAHKLPAKKVTKGQDNSAKMNYPHSIDETKRSRSLTEATPHSLHHASSSSTTVEKAELLVDIKFDYNPSLEPNPVVLSISLTSKPGSVLPQAPISLPGALPLLPSRHEYEHLSTSSVDTSFASIVLPQTSESSNTTASLMELFEARHSLNTLLSPVPTRKALSPLASRTATPDHEHTESHSSAPSASSASHLHTSIFLSSTSKTSSPTHSPLLSTRTLGQGRNSPLRITTPNSSPSNSPSTLYARLNLRRPILATASAAIDALAHTLADRLVDATANKTEEKEKDNHFKAVS